MSSPLRIAIIGAGLAGLSLARVLQLNGVYPTIYELDASPASRNQGGILDMHVESGQHALKAAGLWDEFLKLVRPHGQEFRLIDKYAKVLIGMDGSSNTNDSPEVDRGSLRQILLDSIEAGTIRWGTRVKSIKPAMPTGGSNTWTVVYNDDQEATYDLVIGADGAWSRVRPLLSDAQPTYAGVTLVETRFENVDSKHPEIAELVGQGNAFIVSDGQCLLAQRNGNGSIRNYVTFRIAEQDFPELKFSDPASARDYLLTKFSNWDESLKDLIRKCDDTIVPRPIYALPAPFTWKSVPGVTIIGDAAHLMSPFAGEGANLAMYDGVELAAAIVDAQKTGKDLHVGIAEFEQKMYNFTSEKALLSASNLILFMSKETPQCIVDWFEGMHKNSD
ncbi:hypothetical protein BGW39_006422 [Mortierella sp. 14UC]|nr:hypothetical protein BGW39_006422 [Mortierella sp. 14UC]